MADYNETEMAMPCVNADAERDLKETTEQSRDVKEVVDSTLTIRFRDQTGEEVTCMNAKCSCLFRVITSWLSVNCHLYLTCMG